MTRHPHRSGRPPEPGRFFRLRESGERRQHRLLPRSRFDTGNRDDPGIDAGLVATIHAGSPFWDADYPDSFRSVLLVEDDNFGRETLGRILQVSGYRVLGAANTVEALQYLHGRPRPGLMILDLLLPGSGWELLETKQRDPALAGIPVIVVSAAEPAAFPPLSQGIVAHFEKPVAVPELLSAIGKHVCQSGNG
jgi:CheY-like chemotaxis protein